MKQVVFCIKEYTNKYSKKKYTYLVQVNPESEKDREGKQDDKC